MFSFDKEWRENREREFKMIIGRTYSTHQHVNWKLLLTVHEYKKCITIN